MYGDELNVVNAAIGDSSLATAIALEASAAAILTKTMELPGMALYFGYRPTVTFNYDTLTAKGILTLYRYTKTIQSVALGNAGGTGYAVGDLLSVTQTGASGGVIRVTGVSSGVCTTFEVVNPGVNYTAASNLATVALNGSGDNAATVTISDKKALGTIALANGSVAGKQYMVYVSNAIADVSPTPAPPASYKAGEQLVIEITTQAAGGGYIAGDFQPIIIVHNRAENFAAQSLWVEGTAS